MGNEDRDPLLVAYFSANSASASDAEAWKTRVDADPRDSVARASWIGWNMQHKLHEFLEEAAFSDSVLWMVRNEPSSSLLQLVGPMASGHGGLDTQEELRRAWTEAIATHPRDRRVLENAANHFATIDFEKSHDLLLAVRDLAPDDASTEMRLASHWMSRAKRYPDYEDGCAFEDEHDQDHARRALVHVERAAGLLAGGLFNEWYEGHAHRRPPPRRATGRALSTSRAKP
jgi:hypothetical protein